jgi:Transposase
VRWMIARWRPPKTRGQPKRRLLTRHVPWLLLRAPELLKGEERADLERVLAADAILDAGYNLVQRFRDALHDLDVTAFKRWLFDAAASDLKPFARLAAGMTDDLEAITNAFHYPWSTGPVEGHITRVNSVSSDDLDRRRTNVCSTMAGGRGGCLASGFELGQWSARGDPLGSLPTGRRCGSATRVCDPAAQVLASTKDRRRVRA